MSLLPGIQYCSLLSLDQSAKPFTEDLISVPQVTLIFTFTQGECMTNFKLTVLPHGKDFPFPLSFRVSSKLGYYVEQG